MFAQLLTSVQLLLATLAVAGTPDLTVFGGATAAVAVTMALVAASVVLVAILAVAHPASGGASPPHPRRAIDISSPLTQSDPDAPGHPRPRAPQHAATAA